MKLLRVEIEQFGKLQGFSMELSEGLHPLCRENGWGKSTLAAFIKAMFYGLPATTKRDLDRNERKKYTPWQGGVYGGSLEFSCERGSYRIERFFAAKESGDEFRLFDLSTNKPSVDFSENIGLELFGVDAEGFARSVFFTQSGMDDGGQNDSVTAKLTGLLEDVNDIGCFEGAMELLDKRRRYYEVKGGRGRVADLTAERNARQRDLEDRRRLLPHQEELETRLAEKIQQIRQTEAELEAARGLHRDAEVFAHQREQRARLTRRIAELEEERRRILDAFLDRSIPTDAELDEVSSLLREYREEQARIESFRLTDREREALSSLKRTYPGGMPKRETLDTIRSLSERLPTLTGRLQAMGGEIPPSPEQARFAEKGIPSPALLEEVTRTATSAGQLQERRQSIRQSLATKAKRSIPLPLSIGSMAIGALLLLLGLFLASARLPLCIAGGCLFLLGGVLLLIGGGNGRAAREAKREADEIDTQLRELERLLQGLFHTYGISVSGGYSSAAAELRLLADRARSDAARQAEQERRLRAVTQELNETRRRLSDLLGSLGCPESPDQASMALVRIHGDLREWSRLQAKQTQWTALSNALADAHSEKQARISDFLGRLASRESRQPEECLEQVRALSLSHAHLLDELQRAKADLQAASPASEGQAPLPEPAVAKEDALRLERRLTALREESEELRRRLDRAVEQTEGIPELEDTVAYLAEEVRVAQENLDTLRRTAEFLEASRLALSTRYLDGMQESFTHYLSLMSEGEPPSAFLDVSFDVSVRDGGKSRVVESYSRGWRDLLQFCARLALIKALFAEGEQPFLLLDDPFVNLDETHLDRARALLDRLSSEFQILYLVCHKGRS